jgi:hypothetical protein
MLPMCTQWLQKTYLPEREKTHTPAHSYTQRSGKTRKTAQLEE